MIYLYLFGTCFHFIYVFMIIENYFYNFIYFGYALCPVLIVVMNQKYQETI